MKFRSHSTRHIKIINLRRLIAIQWFTHFEPVAWQKNITLHSVQLHTSAMTSSANWNKNKNECFFLRSVELGLFSMLWYGKLCAIILIFRSNVQHSAQTSMQMGKKGDNISPFADYTVLGYVFSVTMRPEIVVEQKGMPYAVCVAITLQHKYIDVVAINEQTIHQPPHRSLSHVSFSLRRIDIFRSTSWIRVWALIRIDFAHYIEINSRN